MKHLMRVVLTLTLAITSLNAKAISINLHVNDPIQSIITSDCTESVALVGTLTGTAHLTFSDKDQSEKIETHMRFDNVRATGMDSGIQYQVSGHENTHLFLSDKGAISLGYQEHLRIEGLESVHYNYHFMFSDAYDAVTAKVDNFRMECGQ